MRLARKNAKHNPESQLTRREWRQSALGLALLVAGAYLVARAHGAERYFLLNAGREFPAVPVLVLEPTGPARGDSAIGSAVVLHGLGANQVVMLTLGQRLAAAGLRVFLFDAPGHGNNTSSFSFAKAEACAAAVIETLSNRREINLSRTVLVGHSMGGGIAILLGIRFPVAGTIAVAPAPEPLPRGIPGNLLMISAQFDVPAIRQMEKKVVMLGGKTRDSAEYFASHRAFRELALRGRSHTGTIFDPTATLATARWAAASLGTTLRNDYAIAWGGLAGGLLGFAGLGFLFPLTASGFARLWNVRATEKQATAARFVAMVVYWTFSALVGIGVLIFWVPLETLHLYSGDYLASLLVIASIPLLILLAPHWSSGLEPPKNSLGMGATLGLVAILAFGAWLNWQLADGWMNAARWARFPLLACVLLPYCLAEEMALGSPVGLKLGRRFGRFGTYLLLRFILWLAAAYTVFSGLSGALLMVFFFAYLALFSIGQRLGADAVRRRTGSAAAAAFFSAILGAWFIAAAFPLT